VVHAMCELLVASFVYKDLATIPLKHGLNLQTTRPALEEAMSEMFRY
jgi:hypothetical protein